MKKAYLIILFFTIVFRELDGQISLGLSSGINLPTARFVNFKKIKPSRGIFYFVGITPEYHLNSKISILTDIQFSQKGYLDKENVQSSYYRYRYSYVDFLPQLEYKIHKHIGIGLGFNFGFEIKEKSRPNETWQSTSEFDLIKTFDFGLVGSIKGHYRGFNLFLRYNYGLANISNLEFMDENGILITKTGQFNNNIQIGTGYTFKLKKNK